MIKDICAAKLRKLTRDYHNTFLKLHRQLAHATKKMLIALLNDDKVWQKQHVETMAQIE